MRCTARLRCRHEVGTPTNMECKTVVQAVINRWRAVAASSVRAKMPQEEPSVVLRDTCELLQSERTGASENGRAAQLLGTRENSLLIWRTLRRHRVPWETALQLAPAQLTVLSSTQRDFVLAASRRRPWAFAHYVVASWDTMEDPKLVDAYRELARCRTIVEFGQRLSRALQTRPELHGRLPVPRGVLERCYTLGIQAERRGVSAGAALALQQAALLSLVAQSSYSRGATEGLAVKRALLMGCAGRWSEALETLKSSTAVRASYVWSWRSYLNQRDSWMRALATLRHSEGDETTAPLPPLAATIKAAPSWIVALQLVQSSEMNDHRAVAGLLDRPDFMRAAHQWRLGLELLATLPEALQTYARVRPWVDQLPTLHPQYLQLLVSALRAPAHRMYPGTLTRRLVGLARRGDWSAALGLGTAAGYYDVVLPLSDQLPQGHGSLALPSELMTFAREAYLLQSPLPLPKTIARPTEPMDEPRALAHTLYGDWRTVASHPQRHAFTPRLRALLQAKQLEVGEVSVSSDPVRCYTFQSATESQLVASYATEKDRRYFLQVIPSRVRGHHTPTRTCATPARVDLTDLFGRMYNCEDVEEILVRCTREMWVASDPSRERFLLRQLCRLLAAGCVCCPSSQRYALAVALLGAAETLRLRLDTTLALRALAVVPAHILAVSSSARLMAVTCFSMAGRWETVMRLFHRWSQPDALPTSSPTTTTLEEIADRCATAVYAAPREASTQFLCELLESSSSPFVMVLVDLLRGDSRSSMEVLGQRHIGTSAAPLVAHEAQATKNLQLRVLSAGFCLLDRTEVLRELVRQCGLQHIGPGEVDDFARQRLLQALPWEAALTAMQTMHSTGGTVDEHWIAQQCQKQGISCEAVEELRRLRPDSSIVNTLWSFFHACKRGELKVALQSLVLFVTHIHPRTVEPLYWPTFVALVGVAAVHDGWASCQSDEGLRTIHHALCAGLLERLTSHPKFATALKATRHAVRQLLLDPNLPSGTSILLGYLHLEVGRCLQVPVSAAFTSQMLRMSAPHEWQVALHFFKRLRHPTTSERMALVYALRQCDSIASVVLGSRRFLRHHAEQVVLWSDASLSPSERWVKALQWLQAASSEPNDEGELQRLVRGLVVKWNRAECDRALELLRRSGLASHVGSTTSSKRKVMDTQPADVTASMVATCLSERQRQLPSE